MTDQQQMASDLELTLRNPAKPFEWLRANIDLELLSSLAAARRRTDLLQLLYLLGGVLPDVNNIGYHERDNAVASIYAGLRSARTIFRGIKRPCINDKFDAQVYIYILAPAFTYQYAPSMVCAFKRVDAPAKAVYAVYVEIDASGEATVLNAEWVKADEGSTLPANHADRYKEMIWNAE